MINEEEVLCYPAVPFIVCDNKEAHLLSHIKLNSTKRPCRFCKAAKYQIHSFQNDLRECSPDPVALRSFDELRANMNSHEWCDENSVHRDVSKVIAKVISYKPLQPNHHEVQTVINHYHDRVASSRITLHLEIIRNTIFLCFRRIFCTRSMQG